jgi:hypothetical protein
MAFGREPVVFGKGGTSLLAGLCTFPVGTISKQCGKLLYLFALKDMRGREYERLTWISHARHLLCKSHWRCPSEYPRRTRWSHLIAKGQGTWQIFRAIPL